MLVITPNYEQSCTDSEHDAEHDENHDNEHHAHCGISETCEVELLVEEYEKKLDGYAAEVS